MSWSCVEAPWSLQEGNEQAVVQGDLPLSKKQSPDGQGESPPAHQWVAKLELRLSAQPCAGAERRQSGPVGACQLCCLCPHAVMCGSDVSLHGAGRSAHVCLFHLTACTAQVSSPVV